MTKLCKFPLTVIVALAAAPATVWAQQQARCATDSLDPAQAAARLEWARKCGLLTNTSGPSSALDSDTWADAMGNPAKEYVELNHSRAYSGNAEGYVVNFQFAYNLYPASPFYQSFVESGGPTAGYWKWLAFKRVSGQLVQQSPRARPLYPTFGPLHNTATAWYPHPTLRTSPASWQSVNCNLYADPGGTTLASGDFWVASYCESSCYTPDQHLSFSTGEVNIVQAMKARRDDLVTLAPDATLDDLATQTSKVLNYTVELRDAENPIVDIETASGGSLRVTTEHPVVTSEGRLVKAEDLAVGHELLRADGTPDPVVRVERSTHFGRVYNVKPVSPEPVANILIAQGFLVGSARFQNDDVGYMNRIILFQTVPDGVMPR